MCDTELMLNLISESKPEHTPGEQTKYHYLTFGWIVEGLVRGVTGDSLREFVRKNIGEKLNIEEEFMIGIPGENKKENEKKKGESESECESESDGQGKERQIDVNIRIADLVLGRIVMPSPPPAPASATASPVAATADAAVSAPNSDKVTTSSTVTGKIVASPPPLTGTDIPISKLDEVHTPSAPAEEVLSRSYKKRPPSGPSMLMNPTFFNNPRIR